MTAYSLSILFIICLRQMLAGCCAGFIGFLVFVAVAAAISFGPVALKVTMDKLEELEGSILPCAYC